MNTLHALILDATTGDVLDVMTIPYEGDVTPEGYARVRRAILAQIDDASSVRVSFHYSTVNRAPMLGVRLDSILETVETRVEARLAAVDA